MPLSSKQKKHLRAKAHKLKPVVIMGAAGLSDAVLKEIELSIEHHELIKVKLNASDKTARQTLIDTICERIHCECVSLLGQIASFYRAAQKPRLTLPRR